MNYIAFAFLIGAVLFFRGAWRSVNGPRLDQYCFINALFAAATGTVLTACEGVYMTDRCDPATCPNGKCNQTGECIEANRPGLIGGKERFAKFYPDAPAVIPEGDLAPLDIRTSYEMVHQLRPSAPRTIIALTGLAGAGKSTAAAHLVKRHGFQRVRFAGPLKAMMAALGCTPEQIDGDQKETPCDLLGGRSPRYAMQTLGTEWGRDLITPDLWVRAWQAAIAKVPACVPVVVDDCRFPNEAEAVRAANGIIVRIERPGAGTTSAHSSEQHQLEATETIRNIADEQLLRDELDILIAAYCWRKVA